MTTTKINQARDGLQTVLKDLVLLHPHIDEFLEVLAATAPLSILQRSTLGRP